MTDPFIGEIMLFAGNFAPRGWAICEGQTLPISQNTALFSILGTTYGGNGTSTFALPDLRGRVPIGAGQGPDLPSHNLGESSQEQTVQSSDDDTEGVRTLPYLSLNYCIALEGVYPSRN